MAFTSLPDNFDDDALFNAPEEATTVFRLERDGESWTTNAPAPVPGLYRVELRVIGDGPPPVNDILEVL